MSLCIKCGIATDRCNTIGRRLLDDEAILSIVREWVAPRTVDENDNICQSCWNHASSASLKGNRLEEMPVGHRRVCIHCGRSLLRRIRYHELKTDSPQDHKINEVIREWILPRTVGASSVICHSCWVRANRASHSFHSGHSTSAASTSSVNPRQRQESNSAPSVTSSAATIVLPDYFRPVETERRCFVEGCLRRERNRITVSMRKRLLNMYNYYVPPNNRLCDFHLKCTSWDFLNSITGNIINTFNANHIQDMLSLNRIQ